MERNTTMEFFGAFKYLFSPHSEAVLPIDIIGIWMGRITAIVLVLGVLLFILLFWRMVAIITGRFNPSVKGRKLFDI